MLESGFITAALAFVGILPAREIEMTPMPAIGADRPTTTESPTRQGASVSAINTKPLADMSGIHATSNGIDVPSLARIPEMPAISYFIEEWLEYGLDCAMPLDALVRDYKAIRDTHAFLPPISKKRLSQLLVRHGCRKFVSDERDKEGQRHRVVFFDLRQSRKVCGRRAAAA